MSCQVRPLWPPFVAGIVLGLVLLLTFVLVGNGMGASGAFARVATEVGLQAAPEVIQDNAYLGGMAQGNPLAAWVVLAVVGTLVGAILASVASGRFRVKVDRGSGRIGVSARLALALGGGLLAGFGSRLAAGCTSGVGLSNTAMLGVAGFVFLVAFFAVGLLVSLFMRRFW